MALGTKLLLTIAVAVVWVFLVMGSVHARERTIAELQRRDGISLAEAKARVMAMSTLFALLESVAAVVALLFIW
jgi:uncharacterized membrane-anchored protein